METKPFAKIISSAQNDKTSIIKLNVFPGEKTPWHYHELFSETFEVLSGELEVGKGDAAQTLKSGVKATVSPGEKHYYHNVSGNVCELQVTIQPGNKHFEESIQILKGLEKDGLASKAGTPKNLQDLAHFIYLNNSKRVGIQKIAQPVFAWFAKKAVQKGRLNELRQKYCGK